MTEERIHPDHVHYTSNCISQSRLMTSVKNMPVKSAEMEIKSRDVIT